jgi:tetratricopeptide (TPR) repeat protein
MTDEITTALTKVKGLKVIARTSAFAFKGKQLDVREIGHKLDVETLLEGSIKKDGKRLRITVQLIKVSDGSHLWSDSFDRDMESIFDIQDEISLAIADNLKVRLLGNEKAAIVKRPTENLEAYNLYLKGIFETRTFTSSGIQKAAEYFKRAIALDSSYAQAYSGLALSQIARASIISAELNPSEAFSIAKPLIDKALALDPDLGEAHTWNGVYLLYNNWDFTGAENEYKQAILNDDPDALAIYSDFLNFTTRHEEALAISERLDQTNPYYPNSRMIVSLYYMGKYELAIELAESRLALFRNYFTMDSYGFLMLNTGKYEKAIQLFQQALDLDTIRKPRMLGWMGAAYARNGNREKSRELLGELKVMNDRSNAGSLAFFIAVIYASLDDKASALQWLQVAYDNHEMEMPWLISEPQFYALHEEPAFQGLVEKVGFPKTD